MGSFCYSVGIASYSNERCLVPRSDARGKGIIVLPYRINFSFLQESHIWDGYCGQKWDFFPIAESLLHTPQECEASC